MFLAKNIQPAPTMSKQCYGIMTTVLVLVITKQSIPAMVIFPLSNGNSTNEVLIPTKMCVGFWR